MKEVKICGLSRPADIDAVNALEPQFCGFVINYPASRRNVTPETAKFLRSNLKSGITPVGIFVNQPPSVIAGLLNQGIISIAQLHGKEDKAYLKTLSQMTDQPLWQAFPIRTAADLSQAAKSLADFLLLDAGKGGGTSFNWNLLAGFPRPYGLAGGLDVHNLPEALKTNAALLDVSSGVETNGVKDFAKIKEFMDLARGY